MIYFTKKDSAYKVLFLFNEGGYFIETDFLHLLYIHDCFRYRVNFWDNVISKIH